MTPTTVRYPHRLLKRARVRAATDEITLQALLIAALDAELTRRDKRDEQRRARAERRQTATHA
jgi:hypothetical protein